MKRLYFAKYGYMIMSVLFCLTGLAYMFLPDLSMFVLCIAGGLCLLAYGAIKLVGYLSPDLYCLAFQYDMASAILLMITGVLVIFCNTRLQGIVTPGLGLLVLFDSVLTIQMAKDAAKFGIRSWVLLLVAAIITALMGVLLIVNPFESTRIRHVLTGMTVVLEGIMKYCVVLCTVKFPQDGKAEFGEKRKQFCKNAAEGTFTADIRGRSDENSCSDR